VNTTSRLHFVWLFAAGLVVILTGWLLHERAEARSLRDQLRTIQSQLAQARRDYHAALSQLKSAQAPKPTSATRQADLKAAETGVEKLESTLDKWLARVFSLREMLKQNPQLGIPELKHLTEEDWLLAAFDGDLTTESEFREALERLRTRAKMNFGRTLMGALKAYAAANNGALPNDAKQLAPYVPHDDVPALDRYRLLATGTLLEHRNTSVIEEKGPVDPEFDSLITVSPGGVGRRTYSQFGEALRKARTEYQKATNKATANDLSEYLPYAKDPADQALLIERIRKNSQRK
jgi:hypothetical protein